jgi:membrane protein implicated in regulation of membrane protease activity
VTWAFVYLASLLVGLVLAAVTGLVRDLTKPTRHHGVVAPHQDAHLALWSRIGRCLAAALCVFGTVGLVFNALRPPFPGPLLIWAALAGILAALLARLVFRRGCAVERHHGLATVVREIRPGSYGQIRLEVGGVVLAAQGVEEEVIPVGTTVEVLDAERSVVRVRPATR